MWFIWVAIGAAAVGATESAKWHTIQGDDLKAVVQRIESHKTWGELRRSMIASFPNDAEVAKAQRIFARGPRDDQSLPKIFYNQNHISIRGLINRVDFAVQSQGRRMRLGLHSRHWEWQASELERPGTLLERIEVWLNPKRSVSWMLLWPEATAAGKEKNMDGAGQVLLEFIRSLGGKFGSNFEPEADCPFAVSLREGIKTSFEQVPPASWPQMSANAPDYAKFDETMRGYLTGLNPPPVCGENASLKRGDLEVSVQKLSPSKMQVRLVRVTRGFLGRIDRHEHRFVTTPGGQVDPVTFVAPNYCWNAVNRMARDLGRWLLQYCKIEFEDSMPKAQPAAIKPAEGQN